MRRQIPDLRLDELQAFDRRQHRDGRREHGVAVEEGSADHAQNQDQRRAALGHRLPERHQRERAALALVVGVEQHQHVLERDDEQHRPHHQREDAEHGIWPPLAPVRCGLHGLAQRIEGAGADVADRRRRSIRAPAPRDVCRGVPVLGAVAAAAACAMAAAFFPVGCREAAAVNGRGLYTARLPGRKPA